jgi:hypothetical protein
VADDGDKQRKPDFRAAVENLKALAKVLIGKLSLLSSAALFAIGAVVIICDHLLGLSGRDSSASNGTRDRKSGMDARPRCPTICLSANDPSFAGGPRP